MQKKLDLGITLPTSNEVILPEMLCFDFYSATHLFSIKMVIYIVQ
jgi:hypothetical protein